MRYFDAHCHVQFDAYDADRDAVLSSMREASIGGLIVGTDLPTSTQAVALADGKEFFASVGLHPNHETDEWFEKDSYRTLLKNHNVVAVGECGLDYYRPAVVNEETKRKQVTLFSDHIALAGETGKPLMIHARPSKGSQDAYDDALELLRTAKDTFPNLMGNMHFYVGDIETTKKFLELGFTFSFTAVLTFTHDYDDVVRYIPLQNILSETDAPYVAPAPNRGKRNDPLAVREVVRAIAGIRGGSEELVKEAMVANAIRVFNLPSA